MQIWVDQNLFFWVMSSKYVFAKKFLLFSNVPIINYSVKVKFFIQYRQIEQIDTTNLPGTDLTSELALLEN